MLPPLPRPAGHSSGTSPWLGEVPVEHGHATSTRQHAGDDARVHDGARVDAAARLNDCSQPDIPARLHDRAQPDDPARRYARAAARGVRIARAWLDWRACECDGRFDFGRALRDADAARRAGVALCWTLFAHTCPRDVDPLGAAFATRLARFASAAARALRHAADDAPLYNPIDEITFLAHALARTTLLRPRARTAPGDVDVALRSLVRAALAASDAIHDADPRARIVHVEPCIRLDGRDEPHAMADAACGVFDRLVGTRDGALGGHPRHVDVIGACLYGATDGDSPPQPVDALLRDLAARYRRPVLVTGARGVGASPAALARVAQALGAARRSGIAVHGLALDPRLQAAPIDDAAHDPRFEPSPTDAGMDSLIVFSHLRWDFVHQRPQHLLTRLARQWRILYVEEPVFDAGDPWAEMRAPRTGITVLRPHTPLTAPGFHDDQIPLLSKLVSQAVEREKLGRYGVWLYTPMALPLLQKLRPHALVYDCMDELSGFRHAPRQVVQRENALLKIANVVFTGGPSLHEARRARHPAVHHFPSSVDHEHFARAADEAITAPEVRALSRPRIGYFGVIDERVDMALLEAVAQLRPEWQLCMVGPTAKIDAASLPMLPNVHWFGQRPYADLPSFLAGWDVCLLPFAHNDATRYISPTKTLEYMAAGKPVVSTSIADVRSLYGSAVRFADTPAAFVAAIEAALVEPAREREARQAQMQRLVAATSWDDTAERMRVLVEKAARDGLTEAASRMLDAPASRSARAAATRAPQPAPQGTAAECVVIGAGPTGLSAAYHYGEGAVLLEREATVGGWCRSIEDTGFTFDYAGHIMFSNDPYVQELYRLLLGDNVHWQDREAWIYSKGVYTRYPFQGSLHGLPPEVLKECIVGAIEARFGALRGAAAANRDATDCCADGTDITAGAACADDAASRAPVDDFESFIYRTWGAGVARHFAIPYNRKLWAVPLTEMETSWLGGRVPLPDLEEMIEGALMPSRKPVGPNARFGYPLRGGFQALVNGFLPLLRGDLMTRAQVERVSPLLRTVTLRDGRRFHYDTLVSTMPLPQLIAAMGEEAPLEIRRAAAELRHVSVRCVNLGIGRPHLTDKHWIYYPEDPVFHRIFVQGNASPHCNPPGGFGLTCEITYSPQKPLPATGRALIDRCIADCIKVGIIKESDPILTANQLDLPYAYVVYDHGRAARVAQIREWLLQFEIVLAGRYSEWEYYNSDHAFLAGRRAAETARVLAASRRSAKTA